MKNENLCKDFGDINIENIQKNMKLDLIMKFVAKKTENPKMTRKQLLDQTGIADGTLRRYMKELGMGSLFQSKQRVKKTTVAESGVASTNDKNNKNLNLKKAKDIKSGSVSNDVLVQQHKLSA